MRPLPLDRLGTPDLRSPAAFLWWQARQQWGILIVAILLGVAGFGAQAVIPYAVGRAIDGGLDDGLDRTLLTWVGVMAVAALVQTVVGLFSHRFDVQNWLRAAFATSELVHDKVTETGHAVSDELPTGEVVAAVANDALRMGEVYAAASRFVGSVVTYVAVTVVMLTLSVQLGLVIAVGIPVVAGLLALIVKPLQRQQRAQRDAQGRLTTLGADTVSGLRILRGIGGEAVFTRRYREQSQRVRSAGERVARTQSLLDGLQVLMPGLLVALVLWLGARQAVAGQITAGQLVTLYGYAAFLTWPLQNVTESIQFVTRALVAARKIIKVLQIVPATPAAGRRALPPEPAALVDTVSGVALPAVGTFALVGRDPDETARIATRMGRFDDAAEAATPVLLGGVPLAELDKDALRRRVVVAEATSQLFTGLLRDELDVRDAADDDRVLEALRVADAQDVLDSTPGGLGGEMSEKGRSLSGGQRQRAALARALLTDADTLILVEPTSAVDAHTEARIAVRLAEARRGRATLLVTASPLVLDHVDRVLVVRDGRVVTEGTHRELLARDDETAHHYWTIVGRSLDNDAGNSSGGDTGPTGDATGTADSAEHTDSTREESR
ncbi:MAG: ABC transporter ATP-binding protein [Cellulomonadaceae bacterium]